MKTSFTILLFFVAGILLGYFGLLPQNIYHSDYDVYALYLLMFLVGIVIGSDKNSLSVIRKLKLTVFNGIILTILVPVLIVFVLEL